MIRVLPDDFPAKAYGFRKVSVIKLLRRTDIEVVYRASEGGKHAKPSQREDGESDMTGV